MKMLFWATLIYTTKHYAYVERGQTIHIHIAVFFTFPGHRHSLDSLDNSDSFDGTKKRPYSVISLANSSSSSGSSSGSTGPGTETRRNLPWADIKAAVTGMYHKKHKSWS